MLNLQDFFVKFGLGNCSCVALPSRIPALVGNCSSAAAPGVALPSRIPALVTVGVTTASPKFNEKIFHLQHLKRPRYDSNCLF